MSMKLYKFNPKIIPITKLRRDIDILKKILDNEGEAWVVKAQNVFFVALTPEKYLELSNKNKRK